MGTQLVFVVNPNTCINCKTCEGACNEYYGLNGIHRRHVLTFSTELGGRPTYISISCTHCLNPVCVYVCPNNNFQKRRDGIVVLDASGCEDCKKCIDACPNQAPKLNPTTNRVDKCNFCVERISEGLRPVCVDNCVTGALGMMQIDTEELRSHNNQSINIPIKAYTNPSIYIIEEQRQQPHTRKE